jgi:septal ring factor EnvC (AmiA/AmiB activator)
MAREQDKRTSIVLLRPILHEGKHQPVGTPLSLETTLANRLVTYKKALFHNTKAEKDEAKPRVAQLVKQQEQREAARAERRSLPTLQELLTQNAQLAERVAALEGGKGAGK